MTNDSLEDELTMMDESPTISPSNITTNMNDNNHSNNNVQDMTSTPVAIANSDFFDDMEDPNQPSSSKQSTSTSTFTQPPPPLPDMLLNPKVTNATNSHVIANTNSGSSSASVDFPLSLSDEDGMDSGISFEENTSTSTNTNASISNNASLDSDQHQDIMPNSSVGEVLTAIASSASEAMAAAEKAAASEVVSSSSSSRTSPTSATTSTSHTSTSIATETNDGVAQNNNNNNNEEEEDEVLAQALAIALNANKLLQQKHKPNPTTLSELQYYQATPDQKQRELIQKTVGNQTAKDKKLLGLQEEEERKKAMQLEFVKGVNKAKEGIDAFFQKVKLDTSSMSEKVQMSIKELKEKQEKEKMMKQHQMQGSVGNVNVNVPFQQQGLDGLGQVSSSDAPPVAGTTVTAGASNVSGTTFQRSATRSPSPPKASYSDDATRGSQSVGKEKTYGVGYGNAAPSTPSSPFAPRVQVQPQSKSVPASPTKSVRGNIVIHPAKPGSVSKARSVGLVSTSGNRDLSIPISQSESNVSGTNTSRSTNHGLLRATRSISPSPDSPMKLGEGLFLPKWQQQTQHTQQHQDSRPLPLSQQSSIEESGSKDALPYQPDIEKDEVVNVRSAEVAVSSTTSIPQQPSVQVPPTSTTSASRPTQDTSTKATSKAPPPLKTARPTLPPKMKGKAQEGTTLSTMAWKKRSGYGKYSMRNAWEKRRFELVDNKIMYYKVKKQGAGADGDHEEEVVDRDQSSSPPPPQATKQKKDFRNILEQAMIKTQENITKTFKQEVDTSNDHHSGSGGAQSSSSGAGPNEPRGVLDLLKENVTVAVVNEIDKTNKSNVFSTTVPPSPFGLYILIKAEPKWKLCFDTQKDQLKWLTALTDIVIQRSVDTYNEELIRHRTSLSMSFGSSSIGGIGSTSADGEEEHAETAGEMYQSPHGEDGRLWTMDNSLSTRSLFETIDESSTVDDETSTGQEEKKDVVDDDTMKHVEVDDAKDGGMSKILTEYVPIAGDVEKMSLKGSKLVSLCFIMNVAFYQAHSSSSSSFWFILFLLNMAFVTLALPDDSSLTKSLREISTQVTSSIRGEEQRFARGIPAKESSFHTAKRDVTKETPKEKEQAVTKQRQATTSSIVVPTDYKPTAGTTSIRLKNKNDSQMVNGNRFAGWVLLDTKEMQVRSHGYSKTKKKIDSPPTLYEVIAVDAFCSDFRVPEVASKVHLPKVSFNDDENTVKTWHSPDIFVVSIAIPTASPSMGRPTDDGYGFTVTIYYKMKQETRDILKRVTDPSYNPSADTAESGVDVQKRITNAVRLFEEWCRRSPNEPDFQARFKYIPNVHNPKEVGLPNYMIKYAGKPILIKRAGVTGFLSSHPDVNAMEFDISLHPFPYLAKKGTAYLKDFFKKIQVSFTYVIEGRNDDELPEVAIGDGVELCKPDPAFAINGDDFFAGTAPKSF